jgi:hypothetical protein
VAGNVFTRCRPLSFHIISEWTVAMNQYQQQLKAKREGKQPPPDASAKPSTTAAKPAPQATAGGNADRPSTASSSTPRPSPYGRPKPFDAYYDYSRGGYYFQTDVNEWLRLDDNSFRRILRAHGHVRDRIHDNSLNWLEAEQMRIQLERGVAYAGELAGYKAGVHEICGRRLLITRGPDLPEPVAGKSPNLDRFFAQLLGDWRPYFFGWLKAARNALRAGPPWRPGQILVLAGPANCGKNLIQSLITEILGGRAAKPYRYMIGETSFNRDLFSAEHLVIQDETPLSDLKARRVFGSRIKDFTVNELQSYHAKGQDAVLLTPFWRLSISLNEEAENLQILPPLDESIRDKIMLFRCGKTKLPFDGGDPKSRQMFRETLSREIPGFLHWLRGWKLPQKLRNQRFGVEAALDPTLVQEIDSLSPELKLWSLIEASGILPRGGPGWIGSAIELEAALCLKFRKECERLLTWSTACGVYLARLSKKFPDRVHAERGDENKAVWKLMPASSK